MVDDVVRFNLWWSHMTSEPGKSLLGVGSVNYVCC